MSFGGNVYMAMLALIEPFRHADLIGRFVIIALGFASILSWGLIFAFWLRLMRTKRDTAQFEREFRRAEDLDLFHRQRGAADTPISRVFAAGMTEWRRSVANEKVDREGTRERLATTMGATVAMEVDELADRLNILATIGAVSPFVGLFGTVWGIMRSFKAIGIEQSSSLAVVAPGISEALFATAIGLFAAIPAVIAYNRFSHGVNRVEARLHRFADGLFAMLSRRLESEA